VAGGAAGALATSMATATNMVISVIAGRDCSKNNYSDQLEDE
jgi:hypothetical protein